MRGSTLSFRSRRTIEPSRRSVDPLALVGAIAVLFAIGSTEAVAQHDARTGLLEAPALDAAPPARAIQSVRCQRVFESSVSLFGLDDFAKPDFSNDVLVSELYPPFRIWRVTSGCHIIESWETLELQGALRLTGIAISEDGDTYWQLDPEGTATAREYLLPGGLPTGVAVPLPPGFGAGLYGPAVIDSNDASARILYTEEVTSDTIVGIDLDTRALVCTFANADDAGDGAFGNGLGDAADAELCGANLVVSSGAPAEGRVVRVGQYDCDSNGCRDAWDIRSLATFVNDIEEWTDDDGRTILGLIDNASSTFTIVERELDALDCAPTDPDTDVVWVNGRQSGEGFEFGLEIHHESTLATAIQRLAGTNGKFVAQLHQGRPDGDSITRLDDLGLACFDFLGGGASVVANNLGRPDLVGSSNYFGAARPDPPVAPTFIDPTQPVVDTGNLPMGSTWMVQAVIANPGSASRRRLSLTNVVVFTNGGEHERDELGDDDDPLADDERDDDEGPDLGWTWA